MKNITYGIIDEVYSVEADFPTKGYSNTDSLASLRGKNVSGGFFVNIVE